ncbi:hypothetical protein NECID01_1135 [Nematocida sp. AWRm77]|nr:hypothetical protein NECID01_1135 [Nematocida sp. AWRm77]
MDNMHIVRDSRRKKPVIVILLSLGLFVIGLAIMLYGVVDMKLVEYYRHLENKDLDEKIEAILASDTKTLDQPKWNVRVVMSWPETKDLISSVSGYTVRCHKLEIDAESSGKEAMHVVSHEFLVQVLSTFQAESLSLSHVQYSPAERQKETIQSPPEPMALPSLKNIIFVHVSKDVVFNVFLSCAFPTLEKIQVLDVSIENLSFLDSLCLTSLDSLVIEQVDGLTSASSVFFNKVQRINSFVLSKVSSKPDTDVSELSLALSKVRKIILIDGWLFCKVIEAGKSAEIQVETLFLASLDNPMASRLMKAFLSLGARWKITVKALVLEVIDTWALRTQTVDSAKKWFEEVGRKPVFSAQSASLHYANISSRTQSSSTSLSKEQAS